jgi:hypothetical protein
MSKKTVRDPLEEIEIQNPLKDHEIHHNDIHIIIKKGEPVPVPRLFLPNLVTEGVIKTIPKEG